MQAGWAPASGGEREKAKEVAEAILAPFSQEGSGRGGGVVCVQTRPLLVPVSSRPLRQQGEEGAMHPHAEKPLEVSLPGFWDKMLCGFTGHYAHRDGSPWSEPVIICLVIQLCSIVHDYFNFMATLVRKVQHLHMHFCSPQHQKGVSKTET